MATGYLTMLTLQEQQNGLLAILLRWPIHLDPGKRQQSLPRSRSMRVFDRVATWWLRVQIESQCCYTTRMLKRLGCFESHLAGQLRWRSTPPTIEELRVRFLSSLQNHEDPVLCAVARLELACIALASIEPVDSAAPTTICWDRNPNKVMDALDRGSELPGPEPGVRYILRMGPTVPNGAVCIRQHIRC